jgi:hypothetical protein
MTEFNIKWDENGKRFYEAGVDRGVYYRKVDGEYPEGVPWNGLTSVNESPDGAENTPLYANNQKYGNIQAAENFGGSIGAYQHPEEFYESIGCKELAPGVWVSQQTRAPFGMTYRTLIGNDEKATDAGYNIHLVYDMLVSPSEREHTTINENVEAAELSFDFETTPVNVKGMKPTSHLTIDSRKVNADKLAAFEAILYGSGETKARLPLPDEVATLLGDKAAG